jgi:hypothetical protein
VTGKQCLTQLLMALALGLAANICRSQTAPPTPAPDTYDTDPAAEPGRPAVTTPADIPPPGYLQFEQGVVQTSNTPPGVNHQFSILQATKLSLDYHLMLYTLSQPFARSVGNNTTSIDPGDVDVGAQVVLLDEAHGHSKTPTIAVQYTNHLRAGTAVSLDVGSFNRAAQLLAAGDIFGLHYNTEFAINEQPGTAPNIAGHQPPRRAQFGQSLLLTRTLTSTFSVSGEIWRFTQPLTHGNAIGNLYAVAYTPRKTLVFDAGFDRGLTSTSTHWELFTGFTYLLPHRLWPAHKK